LGIGFRPDGSLPDDSATYFETPQPIRFFDDIEVQDVAVGENHTIVLAASGAVYSFGHKCPGLGISYGHQACSECPPAQIRLEAPAVAVRAAKNYTIIATGEGRLFGCGANWHGELGSAVDFSNRGVPTTLFPEPVREVATGAGESTVVRALDGRFWGFGKNSCGQLGLGHAHLLGETPTHLAHIPHNTYQVVLGETHMVVLTQDGQMYGCGRSESFGSFFRYIEANRFAPTMLSRFVLPNNEWVIAAALGTNHTAVVGESGRVYDSRHNTPFQIPQGETFVAITASKFYTSVATKKV
jgi:alpha-tubulin suppressor-like RCC1 family protein